jgi:hypothetical protein
MGGQPDFEGSLMDLDPATYTGIGGGVITTIGGAAWFWRWTKSVDEKLKEVLTLTQGLSTRQAVTDEKTKDIDKIKENVTINAQRALAAHRRLDDLG